MGIDVDCLSCPTRSWRSHPSKEYRIVLVMASALGVAVPAASWAFLELVYEHAPSALGYEEAPW